MGNFSGRVHRHTAVGVMSTGTWPPIVRCRTVMRHRQRSVINIVSEPPPPPPGVSLKVALALVFCGDLFEWNPNG